MKQKKLCKRDYKLQVQKIKQLRNDIIELDKNDDKYLDMLRQPWFDNNQIPENNKIENIKNFLFNIFK